VDQLKSYPTFSIIEYPL